MVDGSGCKIQKSCVRLLVLPLVWIAFDTRCQHSLVGGRMSVCGTEHAFSAHCVLFFFTSLWSCQSWDGTGTLQNGTKMGDLGQPQRKAGQSVHE